MSIVTRLKRGIRGYLARQHAAIMTYHSVVATPTQYPMYCHLHADDFERHIRYLSETKHCVSVAELLTDLRANALKPHSVAITFDDGFLNNLKVALPILEKYRVPATFFIAAGFIVHQRMIWPERVACMLMASAKHSIEIFGQKLSITSTKEKAEAHKVLMREFKKLPHGAIDSSLDALGDATGVPHAEVDRTPYAQNFRMMCWDEVRELARSPFAEIAAHTITHPILTNLELDDARREIQGSKELLETELRKDPKLANYRVRYFAYPNGGVGDYNDHHKKFAIDAGYEAVFTAQMGTVQAGVSVYDLLRVGVSMDTTVDDLDYTLSGGLAPQARATG